MTRTQQDPAVRTLLRKLRIRKIRISCHFCKIRRSCFKPVWGYYSGFFSAIALRIFAVLVNFVEEVNPGHISSPAWNIPRAKDALWLAHFKKIALQVVIDIWYLSTFSQRCEKIMMIVLFSWQLATQHFQLLHCKLQKWAFTREIFLASCSTTFVATQVAMRGNHAWGGGGGGTRNGSKKWAITDW